MAIIDKTFKDLVTKIIDSGYWYDDPYRKGVKRKELSTYTLKHDLTKEFPVITTKDLYWKGVVGELLWFLRGNTNIKYLVDNNINIWNKDAYNYYLKLFKENIYILEKNPKNDMNPVSLKDFIDMSTRNNYKDYIPNYIFGDIGRVYGAQWRSFGKVENLYRGQDQISNLIKGMKERPLATDLLVTAWNPAELNNMALPPCHFGFQVVGQPLHLNRRFKIWFDNLKPNRDSVDAFDVLPSLEASHDYLDFRGIPKYGFTLVWDQRSVDTFLGLPFNIASYGLLAHILGKVTNMIPLEIVGNLRNVHIYDNAIDAIQEQMDRDVDKYNNCNLNINETTERVLEGTKSLDEKLKFINISDFKLDGYESYPPLKVEMLARD